MKTLPEYFIILRDATNPLWDKYIQWLFDVYKEHWTGKPQGYYGYDGGSRYNGTNVYDNPKSFKNNPTIITLDYWNECVNGFQLPEKWEILRTPDNAKVINDWMNRHHNAFGKDYVYEDLHGYVNNFNKTKCKEGFTEITFKQFKKYVLKQDNMEKKLIGYKLVKPEMFEAAFIIIYGNASGDSQLRDVVIFEDYITKLKEAGVLDLWFEPVYKAEEPKFKKGDFVTVVKGNSGGAFGWWSVGDVYILTNNPGKQFDVQNCAGSTNGWNFTDVALRLSTLEEILDFKVKEFTYKTGIKVGSTIVAPGDISGKICWDDRKEWRKSTAAGNREVLKFSIHPDNTTLLLHTNNTSGDVYVDAYKMKLVTSTPNITIKGYKAEFTEDSVSFGCQTYSKEFVLTLANCLRKNSFAMEIRDEIMEIAKYFESL